MGGGCAGVDGGTALTEMSGPGVASTTANVRSIGRDTGVPPRCVPARAHANTHAYDPQETLASLRAPWL